MPVHQPELVNQRQATVKALLTPEEENLITLMANIVVDKTINELHEKRNSVSAI